MSENTTQHLPNGSTFEEKVFARFDAIDARLHALEPQAEQRAVETKPIWERALAEILEVKEVILEVKEEILEVKEKVADLDRKFSIVTEDILQVRADQVRLERRIDRLEPKPTH
jgi:chromosome segregation ATPase